MLAPDDRSTLLHLLAPPDGYELDCAVGTTFSLDLVAFLMVPAAMTLAGAGDATDEDAPAPLELLESLRRTSSRITVFCQAGQISVPAKSKTALLPFLEAGTVPVVAPRGGVFHPKVWALRYADRDGSILHRLLVLSRNLTFDRCWDTVLRLDEADHGQHLPGLCDFLRRLPELAVGRIDDGHLSRVHDLAAGFDGVRFEVPPPFTSMDFHALGIGQNVDPVPSAMTRVLVVSPFLRRERLDAMDVAPERLTVVSRPEELDATFTADDGVETFHLVAELDPLMGDQLEASAGRAVEMGELAGLHAKLVVADTGNETVVITGSANATVAAFTRNVEAVAALVGPSSTVGVKQWLKCDPQGGRGKEKRFADLLEEHELATARSEVRDDELGSDLDLFRRELAAIPVVATVTESIDDPLMRVRYFTEEPWPQLAGAAVTVRPVTFDPAQGRSVTLGTPLDLTERVTLRGLTGFLAVDVSHATEGTSFLLWCDLQGVPERRIERLLAEQIGSLERLLHYLLLLLMDPAQLAAAGTGTSRGHGWDLTSGGLDSLPILELLARALTGRTDRITELGELLRAIREGDRDMVPDELWELCQTVAAVSTEIGATR